MLLYPTSRHHCLENLKGTRSAMRAARKPHFRAIVRFVNKRPHFRRPEASGDKKSPSFPRLPVAVVLHGT